ncbi:hypothetical protein [Mariniflexile sp. AS56]|uniref:hypothetical protein n=1 Tax=Mariniflexile sp. AS56 TaxID=3063957 RepID=UPI0026EED261|nr:hypothetical protein [Mariniflexile sp. AS56]MDO7171827.1 hypothetical protein [Mariniflexile sp. AS56]
MKMKPYFIVILITFFTCSKNDDTAIVVDVESFNPTSISFVYADGTAIAPGDCINPDASYAIQVETSSNSNGNTKVSRVEYTINGALYSMSFSQAGSKRNPIVLQDGRNVAELVSTAFSAEISYISQGDFVVVD